MSNSNILHINSSGRTEGSVTRQVSKWLVENLKQQDPTLEVINRDLATGLPFVDQQWIGANFTPPEERSEKQIDTLSFSDNLVSELQNAKHIVIASPIYNFNIPAVLKAWVDLIARARVTFRYTENGPEGLLNDKQAYLVMASGGVPIGSEMDLATQYLRQVLSFIGITKVKVIDSTQVAQESELVELV